ncbi:MAG: sulfotransferase [Actinomycetes bacterium]
MRFGALVSRIRTQVGLRTPPRCPAGWQIGPPDFVGLGAQRAGTTRLYGLVAAHPGVQGAATKELHYFHRYWNAPFTAADVEAYARWFPRPAGLLAGEWSPGYLAHFWIPPLLARAAPGARCLVSLRDPVERYRSGAALQSETRRPGPAAASAAFRLGCYGLQLEHVLSSIPRSRLHVVQYEACTDDIATVLAGVYRFLGLDDSFRPPAIDERVNAARAGKAHLDPDLQAALVDAYTPDVRRLLDLDLGIDVSRWPNFAHLAS